MSGWAALGAAALDIGAAVMDHQEKKKDREHGEYMFDKNTALQKEFAKHGLSWKVADAKASGIHPLAALGANTISYTPQSVGSGGRTNWAAHSQNLSRSLLSRQVESSDLDNKIKKTQLKAMKWELLQKIKGQQDPTIEKSVEVPKKRKGHPHLQAGDQPTMTVASVARGRKRVTTSEEGGQMLGDEAPPAYSIPYNIREFSDWSKDQYVVRKIQQGNYDMLKSKHFNRLVTWLKKERKLLKKPKPGYEWRYSVTYRDWAQKPIGKKSRILDHKLPNVIFPRKTKKRISKRSMYDQPW